MKKWITYTLGVLLLVAALGVVGFAGYRIGSIKRAAQSQEQNDPRAQMPNFEHSPRFNNFGKMDHGNMPDRFTSNDRGFGRGDRSHGGFFFPLGALFKLFVLGGVIWLGLTFAKNSGWQFVKVDKPVPAPVTEKKSKKK